VTFNIIIWRIIIVTVNLGPYIRQFLYTAMKAVICWCLRILTACSAVLHIVDETMFSSVAYCRWDHVQQCCIL